MVRVVAAETGQLGDVCDGERGNFREEAEFYVPMAGLENEGGQILEQLLSPLLNGLEEEACSVQMHCQKNAGCEVNFERVGGTHKLTHGKKGKR